MYLEVSCLDYFLLVYHILTTFNPQLFADMFASSGSGPFQLKIRSVDTSKGSLPPGKSPKLSLFLEGVHELANEKKKRHVFGEKGVPFQKIGRLSRVKEGF